MKVKIDFVTNSSSSCFILSMPQVEIIDLEKYVSALNKNPEAINEGVHLYNIGENLKELQEYTNNGPLDWASLPGGPQFWNMDETHYNMARNAIENGHTVVEVTVDYSVCEQFQDTWRHSVIGLRD